MLAQLTPRKGKASIAISIRYGKNSVLYVVSEHFAFQPSIQYVAKDPFESNRQILNALPDTRGEFACPIQFARRTMRICLLILSQHSVLHIRNQ